MDKVRARVNQYRSNGDMCKDAKMLQRFFALKVEYKVVVPLKPEPAGLQIFGFTFENLRSA